MGQSSSRAGGSQADERRSSNIKDRLQVLEDLVQGTARQRRQHQLRELTADSAAQPTRYSILPRAPEEFKLGYLIAAGSYGRIYAGSYRGQPAALKLLILEEESAAAILNEVRLCLKLNHRNLVRLLDCAVVSTSMRQYSGSRNTQDAPSAGWWYSNEQQGYNYLPMMAGEQNSFSTPASPAISRSNSQRPFVEVARASSLEDPRNSSGNNMLSQDCRPGLGLTSASGHACYEVWIAMELCDGGTLAEQVQQGFQYCPASRQVDMEVLLTVALDTARALLYMHAEHVCHGDLKAENVLLKMLGSEAGDSSYLDSSSECSWLQVLCHITSSSNNLGRGRPASHDSFWSFAKSFSPKSSTVASSSSQSSTGASFRSRWQSSGGLLALTSLCCAGANAVCEDADDAVGPDQKADESMGRIPAAVTDTGQQHQQDTNYSGSSIVSCSTDVAARGQLQHEGMASPAALVAPVLLGRRSAAAADGECLPPSAQIESGDSTNIHLAGAQQPAAQTECSSPQAHAADEAAEEEHIAPLSLYSTAREQRRSRRLSSTALMPSVQAALAAAAAAGLLDATLNSGKVPYNSSSSSRGDTNNQLVIDEEVAVTHDSAASGSQQKQQGTWSPPIAISSASEQRLLAPHRTGQCQEVPRYDIDADAQLTRASSSPALDKLDGGAAAAFGSNSAARSQGRSRRHSYCCYGSRSFGYSAVSPGGATNNAPPTSHLRQLYTCSHAGISAAEAAAVIAAAVDEAKAARGESQLARRAKVAMRSVDELSAAGNRRHRSRRMSCDDRLLQHMSSTTAHAAASSSNPYLGGRAVIGQGRLPLALRRSGSSGTGGAVRAAPVHEGAAATAANVSPSSKRRHSWTSACLEGAMDATAAAQYLRGLAKCLMPNEQQQCARRLSLEFGQQSAQLTRSLLADNSNSSSQVEDSKQQYGGPASGNGRRRRHSWAGFFVDQQPLSAAAGGGGSADLPTGKPTRAQRLSACFLPSDMAVFSPASSPRSPTVATLASCVGCCGDATRSALAGDSFSTDAETRQLLQSEYQSSSVDCPVDSPLAEATDARYLGRFGQRSSRRSHCCGTTDTDFSAVLVTPQSSSNSSGAELLRPAQSALAAPSAAAAPTLLSSMSFKEPIGGNSAVPDSSTAQQQSGSLCTSDGDAACNSPSAIAASHGSAQQLQCSGATSNSAIALDRELPLELFTGSFDCKHTDGSRHSSSSRSSRRSSHHSSSMNNTADALDLLQDPLAQQQQQQLIEYSLGMDAQEDTSAAASSSNIAASTSSGSDVAAVSSINRSSSGGRERRWSTGVAAHDLLTRQQGLPDSGANVRRGTPSCSGHVLAAAPMGSSRSSSAGAEHPGSYEQSPVVSGSLANGRSHVVDVLGMPRTPTSVLGQRRMSYDAMTGAYTMIDQRALDGANGRQRNSDISHLQKEVHPQQPNKQEQLQHSQDAQQDQQQQELDQRRQALMQERMQRLLEALSKRGYAGINLDNNSRAASPTQQQQQRSSTAVAPASGSVPVVAASAGSAARSMSPNCVPPAYSRPKYCAKVCDFGFSQCLRAGQSHCSTINAGTITHQAPEVLKSGYLSPAADIYAFGIILWELLTGDRPFRGLLEGDLIGGVCEHGLRPEFPPGAPEAYVALAKQCWAESHAERPTARQLLKRLNEMLYEVRRHKQLDTPPVQRSASGSSTPSSRPRRHSMPAVGGGRQRRLSRRWSQFLPFGRPVTVLENAPLEPMPAADVASSVLASDSNMAAGWRGSRAQTPVPQADPVRVKSWQNVPNPAAGSGAPAATAVAVASTGSTPAGAPGNTEDGGFEWFQSFD